MHHFESKIRYSEVDESGKLSVFALVNYLQDCATFHSEAVGMGPRHVAATGLAWLISAWKIEISELPDFGDAIDVATWPTSFKGLRANRCYTVRRTEKDAEAPALVRADSHWFMYDTNVGRPIRVPEEESAPYLIEGELEKPLDLPAIPRTLRAEGEGVATTPLAITSAHLDTNHHVNNAQYVSIALAALPQRELSLPCTLDVHYSTAATLGDVIYPHVHEQADGTVVTLDDASEGGKPYATVRVSA